MRVIDNVKRFKGHNSIIIKQPCEGFQFSISLLEYLALASEANSTCQFGEGGGGGKKDVLAAIKNSDAYALSLSFSLCIC